MFMNPYISSQLAAERQRDMLAHAQHHRLIRRLHAEARAVRHREQSKRRLRRAPRTAARLRTAAQA
jgi:hypothetical protein